MEDENDSEVREEEISLAFTGFQVPGSLG